MRNPHTNGGIIALAFPLNGLSVWKSSVTWPTQSPNDAIKETQAVIGVRTGSCAMITCMIASITGEVAQVERGFAVIVASGIGYRVFMTEHDLLRITHKTPAHVATYLAVREDALDLYGFLDSNDLRTFELLLRVSGIGPRSALSILGIAGTVTISTAVANGKPEFLTKHAGIGKKTAEKVVRELAGTMTAPEGSAEHLESDEEAAAALTALGYTEREAREALAKIAPETTGVSARLREALKIIGGKST